MPNSPAERAVAVLCLLLLAAPAAAQTRFALLVGANAGWTDDRPLRHAETDAERMRQVLLEVGGFSPERVELLREPDTGELRARLRRLAERISAAGPDTLLVFYYSGHADQRQLHLRGTPLTWEELHATLREVPARVRVGLIDACRSGAILGSKGAVPTAAFEVKVEEPVVGMAVITSSGADELSQETKALSGSVFTHHFVSALRGAADSNRDGQVGLGEAYQYSYERTAADTAQTQAPQRPAFRQELKGQGELVLSRLKDAQAALVLPAESPQRYVVVDERELRLWAEGWSSSAGEVRLAAPVGSYRVKRVRPDRLEVATASLGSGSAVKVAALSFEERPLGSGLLKGSAVGMDFAELHAFKRSEALRLLAAGEAGSALKAFEALVLEDPTDLSAHRGRARALVRQAEAYERMGDHEHELVSLRTALSSDPSLTDDPGFQRWYRRMLALEEDRARDAALDREVRRELDENPRKKKRWGFGIEVLSTRGVLVLTADALVVGRLFAGVGFSPVSPGFDVQFKVVPWTWRLAPWVGAGGYVSLKALGGGGHGTVGVNGEQLNYDQIWSTSGHLDLGVQYFGTLGFCVSGGLGLIFFPDPVSRQLRTLVLPDFSMAWYF